MNVATVQTPRHAIQLSKEMKEFRTDYGFVPGDQEAVAGVLSDVEQYYRRYKYLDQYAAVMLIPLVKLIKILVV